MEIKILITILLSFITSAFIFIPVGIFIRKKKEEKQKGLAEKVAKDIEEKANNEAKKMLADAQKEIENLEKDSKLKLKEQALKMKADIDEEVKERRAEVVIQEKRIIKKEEIIEKKEEQLEKEKSELLIRTNEIEKREEELEYFEQKQNDELIRIAKLTEEEARNEILQALDNKLVEEKAEIISKRMDEINKTVDKEAKNIISAAIEKCAADHTSESTITTVFLPNDEVKGKIIGREGRNIRTLELLTGVNFIIDDTPETITISAFDPIRREVARVALEKLIEDGRIHPAKIEEFVEKAISDITEIIMQEGERAIEETGVTDLPEEIVMNLGKLKYRTSYGQNVLTHSIEVSILARNLATSLGVDGEKAALGGLLHDIGKALDHEANNVGTHLELGMDLLKKYITDKVVLNAVEAHHGDVPYESVEAVLVKSADAISSARIGARRDSFEQYIKRLESLESIADSFKGVKKSYAIQAGRELRLIVDPEKISDDEITILARDVAEKVENEVAFPGKIKITVIREKRSLDYAKQSKVNRNDEELQTQEEIINIDTASKLEDKDEKYEEYQELEDQEKIREEKSKKNKKYKKKYKKKNKKTKN